MRNVSCFLKRARMNVSFFLKRACMTVAALCGLAFSSTVVFAASTTGAIASTDIVTDTAIANITIVGLAMIGVVLVKFGIKAAKSMIN